MASVQLPFGKTSLNIALPPQWINKGVLSPVRLSGVISVAKECRRQLREEITGGPWDGFNFSSSRLCVVIDDATRPTPVNEIFPSLLEVLIERGFDPSNLTVLVACGTHAPMSRDMICRRLGVEEDTGLRIINHNCFDEKALFNLGASPSGMRVSFNRQLEEADGVVLVGTIEPHIMAGFGGGLKNLLPGCAGLETIMDTHLMGSASERFGNIGLFRSECPVRARIDEGALMLKKPVFLINTVLDPDGRPVGFFCGDPVDAFDSGCRMARELWGIPVKEQVDIVIASSNPMNHDLCQASKAFGTAIRAVKNGGLLIVCISVENGVGDYCVSPAGESYEKTRDRIRSFGVEEYVAWKKREKGKKLPFYEVFLTHSCGEALRKADIFVFSKDIPLEQLNSFGLFKAFDNVNSLIESAEKEFPEAGVLISPHGGVCFPDIVSSGKT